MVELTVVISKSSVMPFTNCTDIKASGMKTRTALGKRVSGNLYFHITALERFDPQVREQVRRAALQAGLEIEAEFSVIKIDEEGQQFPSVL